MRLINILKAQKSPAKRNLLNLLREVSTVLNMGYFIPVDILIFLLHMQYTVEFCLPLDFI